MISLSLIMMKNKNRAAAKMEYFLFAAAASFFG